jgi:hypothetical protein
MDDDRFDGPCIVPKPAVSQRATERSRNCRPSASRRCGTMFATIPLQSLLGRMRNWFGIRLVMVGSCGQGTWILDGVTNWHLAMIEIHPSDVSTLPYLVA